MRLGANKRRNRREAYGEVDKPKMGGYEAQPSSTSAPASTPATYEAPKGSSPGVPPKTLPPSIPPSLSSGNAPPDTCGCKSGAENRCPAGPRKALPWS
jgi:hypothetical protein